MQSRIVPFMRVITLIVMMALVPACSTIEYRDIQGEFVDAVAADNAWSVSPFAGNAAEGLYTSIRTQLTDEYIAKLDDRLKPNAWLLRAVSEWRLGEFSDARNSAKRGLASLNEAQKGSRDHVMLAMLDGLIIDSDLRAQYQANEGITLEMYQEVFSPDFATALNALDDGYAQAGPATPEEVGWYYHYHRWRLIANWRSVVNSMDDENRKLAKEDAESQVGGKLRTAMDAERDSIPDNHPLRQLIAAKGGG